MFSGWIWWFRGSARVLSYRGQVDALMLIVTLVGVRTSGKLGWGLSPQKPINFDPFVKCFVVIWGNFLDFVNFPSFFCLPFPFFLYLCFPNDREGVASPCHPRGAAPLAYLTINMENPSHIPGLPVPPNCSYSNYNKVHILNKSCNIKNSLLICLLLKTKLQ